jgi:hypothetical protein
MAERNSPSYKPKSMAEYAREAADLTVERAAKLARICPAYLRQVERQGGAPYVLAVRLSHIYGCPLSAFLRFDLGKERPK